MKTLSGLCCRGKNIHCQRLRSQSRFRIEATCIRNSSSLLRSASLSRCVVSSFSTAIHEPAIKCGNDHITWPKNEFVNLLSQDVKDLIIQRNPTGAIPNKLETGRLNALTFQQIACAMERLISLQTFDDADMLISRFKVLDPDRVKLDPSSGSIKEPRNCEEEMNFLSHFSPFLKQAGFSEISQEDIKRLFSTHHVYDNIEAEVNIDHYLFLRVWIFGKLLYKKEKSEFLTAIKKNNLLSMNGDSEYNASPVLSHRRVVIMAKSKKKSNMILKCFKDVPVGHYESLLPEAKVNIPMRHRWILNSFLIVSGLTFFVNFGFLMMAEYKLGYIMVMFSVAAFIMYRTRVLYRNKRNRYEILWKQTLYYKSTANNSALVMEILNLAKNQNFKKTLLAYFAALQVAQSNDGVTCEQIESQCKDWLNDKSLDCPERMVNYIDFGMSMCNLINMGLLVHGSDGEKYDVIGLSDSLERIKQELISHCIELCDPT